MPKEIRQRSRRRRSRKHFPHAQQEEQKPQLHFPCWLDYHLEDTMEETHFLRYRFSNPFGDAVMGHWDKAKWRTQYLLNIRNRHRRHYFFFLLACFLQLLPLFWYWTLWDIDKLRLENYHRLRLTGFAFYAWKPFSAICHKNIIISRSINVERL